MIVQLVLKLTKQFFLHDFLNEFIVLSDDNLLQFSEIFDEFSVFKKKEKDVNEIGEEAFNVEHLPGDRVGKSEGKTVLI